MKLSFTKMGSISTLQVIIMTRDGILNSKCVKVRKKLLFFLGGPFFIKKHKAIELQAISWIYATYFM